jgi:pyrimidine-specific ribonucleoside hydrolase
MGVGGALHDPLALAVVIDPKLITTREAHVAIDLTGTYTFGATVADYWNERRLGTNVKVASTVDSDRFFEMLYALLKD